MSIMEVRVKPGSKKGPLVQAALDGSLLVYVREAAIEGRANKAVIELIADYLNLPNNNIKLISGKRSRIKYFEIS